MSKSRYKNRFCLGRRRALKTLLAGGFAALSSLAGCRAQSILTTPDGEFFGPLEKKIAGMLMVGFRGAALDDTNFIVRDIRNYNIGGVVLYDYDIQSQSFGRNITDSRQLKGLTSGLSSLRQSPLIIALDQEGGQRGTRLRQETGFKATLNAGELGRLNDLSKTRQQASYIAGILKEHGINYNLAPVVDVNVNPESPAIGRLGRSFSSDPLEVFRHAAAFIEAHDKEGVLTALKHFPGHGSSTEDSHTGFTDVTDTWSQQELIPYEMLIEKGLCRSVMTAHIFNRSIDKQYPATLSRLTIEGILRKRLGFNQVVITDDMQMGAIARHYSYETAVRLSVLAGADMLLVANNSAYEPEITPLTVGIIARMVREGEITQKRIELSLGRIARLHKHYLSD